LGEFVRVARLSDIPPGTVKGVRAKGKEIAVANVDGQAYAVGDRCPHLRYHLHNGTVEGTILECPGHGAKFDLADGGVCHWVTHPGWYRVLMEALYPRFLKGSLPSYATRVEGDDVYVEV
jgi:3-phenylpropionate/trans-cinnamate dioxygenase ferredoxin subunit